MTRSSKLFHGLIAFIFILGLLAPASAPVRLQLPRLHPMLAELAQADPDQPLRIIVQKAGSGDQAERLVAHLGGTILKDLHLINGFAAELPAGSLPRLASNESVSWVSLDAPVAFADTVTETVRDEFNSVSYSNNDGSVDWSSAWIETGDNGSPSGGNITVEVDECPQTSSRCIEFDARSGLNDSLEREVDLSNATSATLTFDYRLDHRNAQFKLEVSSDGGGSWTTLQTYSKPENSTETFDLSAYISASTRIRIRLTDTNEVAHFYLDNVEISYQNGGGALGADLAGNVTIRDEFNSVSYSNNDGSVDWSSAWIETGDNGSPSGGNITVEVDDCPQSSSRCIEFDARSGSNDSLEREVDLSSATSATLTFDYHLDREGAEFKLEVSSDGGDSWTSLQTYEVPENSSDTFDLSAYISASTRIRIRLIDTNDGAHFYLDNVQIDAAADTNTYLQTLGVDQLHGEGLTGQGITVAVIDSGIANHPDFTGRLIAVPEYPIGDDYGHGTHVAGIIGGDGSASGGVYAGIAPGVNLISLGVSDEHGMAHESDVVDALQWVHENKDTYNIRVVNLSLNSTVEDSYNNSGIDAAVEILWFDGVVVVASAGNKGPAGSHNTAKTAPANDPFIIVVGASFEHDSFDRSDDTIAAFSSFGITSDGFERPDIIAPGYNIYSALSPDSSWGENYPDRLGVGGQYIRLSGTSMAAPMVTGAVALLLQDEPGLSPDQVKYRLLNTGTSLVSDEDQSYAYLDVYAAVHGTTSEAYSSGAIPHKLLAQMALIAYWASENGGEDIDWGDVNWDSVNWNAVNWDSVNWNAVNWNAVNWNAVNWNAVNWNAVNWNAVNWNAVNWNAVNWNAVNWNAVNWNAIKLDGVFWGRGNNGK